MDYKYRIYNINEECRWIYIDCNDEFCLEEPDSFVNLVKTIQKDIGGNIENVGDIQYIITNDKLNLVYRWDDLFGIVVIYPKITDKDQALKFLDKYMSEW